MPPKSMRASTPCLLVVAGPERVHWSEPLESAIAKGVLEVFRIESLHDAAANFVLLRQPCLGVLIDPRWLSSHELQMVSVIKRHTSLPIWMLPEGLPNNVAAAHASAHAGVARNDTLLHRAIAAGILPWEQAARSLTQILQHGYTPVPAQGSKGAFSRPDNTLVKQSEIPVATHLATGYHAHEARLLSPAEIQALLGNED